MLHSLHVSAELLLLASIALLLLVVVVISAESLWHNLRPSCILWPYSPLRICWIAAHGIVFGRVRIVVAVAVGARCAAMVDGQIVPVSPTVVVVVE